MTATTIQELFEKPVDRPIDGVIKADDIRNLKIELDEYVITREVAKGLNVFSEAKAASMHRGGRGSPMACGHAGMGGQADVGLASDAAEHAQT